MSGTHSRTARFNHPPLVRVSILVTMLAAFWLALAIPAGAQDEGPPPVNDAVSCGGFQTQADAQEVLVFGELDADGIFALDPDGNGIACEGVFPPLDPNSPPPARDYVSCGHFDSQASAQEMLDSGLLDENGRASLDGDGDGIACEIRWGAPSGENVSTAPTSVTTLPKTGIGPGADDGHVAAVMSTILALMSGALLAVRKQIAR